MDLPTKTVERFGMTFGKLTARDRAEIVKQQRDQRKAQLVANLDAAGITGEEKFNELESFDLTPRGLDDYVRYCNTLEGQTDILMRGLKKLKPDATDADLEIPLDADATLRLSAEVAGLSILTPTAPEGKAEEEPRPSADVYDQETQ